MTTKGHIVEHSGGNKHGLHIYMVKQENECSINLISQVCE